MAKKKAPKKPRKNACSLKHKGLCCTSEAASSRHRKGFTPNHACCQQWPTPPGKARCVQCKCICVAPPDGEEARHAWCIAQKHRRPPHWQ